MVKITVFAVSHIQGLWEIKDDCSTWAMEPEFCACTDVWLWEKKSEAVRFMFHTSLPPHPYPVLYGHILPNTFMHIYTYHFRPRASILRACSSWRTKTTWWSIRPTFSCSASMLGREQVPCEQKKRPTCRSLTHHSITSPTMGHTHQSVFKLIVFARWLCGPLALLRDFI